jgi:hypothetical protein
MNKVLYREQYNYDRGIETAQVIVPLTPKKTMFSFPQWEAYLFPDIPYRPGNLSNTTQVTWFGDFL